MAAVKLLFTAIEVDPRIGNNKISGPSLGSSYLVLSVLWLKKPGPLGNVSGYSSGEVHNLRAYK
ncbi:hypothetical protein HAX54_036698, partial [Datura stramonium]|nr:hypothetical protein [Datura stramonium]